MTKSDWSHYRLWHGIYGEPELSDVPDIFWHIHWRAGLALLIHGINKSYYVGSYPGEAIYMGFVIDDGPFEPLWRIFDMTENTVTWRAANGQ